MIMLRILRDYGRNKAEAELARYGHPREVRGILMERGDVVLVENDFCARVRNKGCTSLTWSISCSMHQPMVNETESKNV